MNDRSIFSAGLATGCAAAARRLDLDDLDDDSTSLLDPLGELVSGHALVVAEDTPVTELCRLLVEHRVPALAVADRAGRLRGLVTRTDVLRATDAGARACDAMSGFVFALPASSSVERAAALMAYEGVGQIVVTGTGGALLGMVSAIDIVRYYTVIARPRPS
jgi:CBS domain-containing protein